jgi:hypothetical protein
VQDKPDYSTVVGGALKLKGKRLRAVGEKKKKHKKKHRQYAPSRWLCVLLRDPWLCRLACVVRRRWWRARICVCPSLCLRRACSPATSRRAAPRTVRLADRERQARGCG